MAQLAVVTGASSGIGFELAKLFADDGYDLIVAADDDAFHVSADRLSASGVDVMPAQVDLRKPDEVERLYGTIADSGRGRLTVAALNAGTGGAGPFIERDLDEDLGIVDLNVRSTVHLAKLLLRDMVDAGAGRMLFTSSVAATMPGSLQTIYNASKSFIQSFAEALHDELRDTDVSVTSLMPGPTATEFFRRSGMEHTVVGRMPKDDPRRVAQQGYEAMMRGDRKVVAESALSKIIGVGSRFLPDSVKAVSSRLISIPVGQR